MRKFYRLKDSRVKDENLYYCGIKNGTLSWNTADSQEIGKMPLTLFTKKEATEEKQKIKEETGIQTDFIIIEPF